jgi:hypothetical protein
MADLVLVNDYADVNVSGQGSIGIQLSGTWAGTVSFTASVDNTNFVPLLCFPANSGTAVTNTTTSNVFTTNVGGLTAVRTTLTSTTSGTVVVTWRVSANPR